MSLPSISGMLSGHHGFGPHGPWGGKGQQPQQGVQGIPAEEPSKPELPFMPAQPPIAQNPQFNAKEVKQVGKSGNQPQPQPHGPQQDKGKNQAPQGPGIFGPHGPGIFGPHGPGIFGPHGGFGPGFGPHGGFGPQGNKQQQPNKK